MSLDFLKVTDPPLLIFKNKMKPRYWFGLNRYIHPLGFGCWQLAGDYSINGKPHGWGEIERKEAIRLIQYALGEGIQFFDTAASYGIGRSEEILGEAINTSSSKHRAIVCSKISLTEKEIKRSHIDHCFQERFEKSLNRLKLERIDVLLIHNPPDSINWNNFNTRILDDLRAQGKIGTYGVSCRSLKGMKNVLQNNFGTCIQWVFNLLERRPADEIFAVFREKEMNFIARSPLARGLLSSKYLYQDPIFDSQEFRSALPKDWIEWALKEVREIERLNIISSTLSALAIRYCLSFEKMSVVIPGIRKKKYLEEFLHVAEKNKLDKTIIDIIESKIEKNYPQWA